MFKRVRGKEGKTAGHILVGGGIGEGLSGRIKILQGLYGQPRRAETLFLQKQERLLNISDLPKGIRSDSCLLLCLLSLVLSLSHPRQVPVSCGGDAPVPAHHRTVSEQDASRRDQG